MVSTDCSAIDSLLSDSYYSFQPDMLMKKTYVCKLVFVCIHVRMSVQALLMYVHMYIHTYVCIYVLHMCMHELVKLS